MGLVNELQESAERDDVLTVLRKAKRVASKLGRDDIAEWLEYEQNGYTNGATLPDYRQVRVAFYYNTNGYIPGGMGMAVNGLMPMPWTADLETCYPVRDAIGAVCGWTARLSEGKGSIYVTLNGPTTETLRSTMTAPLMPELLEQLSFHGRLDDFGLRNIPERVKDHVLQWACRLEAVGVHGEGHTFTSSERQIAQTLIYNVGGNLNQHTTQQSNVEIAGDVLGGVQAGSPGAAQRVSARQMGVRRSFGRGA